MTNEMREREGEGEGEREQLLRQKNNNGYYVKKDCLSVDSINTFFSSFKKIVEFFLQTDLSKCSDFTSVELSSILIETRLKNPKIFSAIYDTLLKSNAINKLIYSNSLDKYASEFLDTKPDIIYTHGIQLRMDTPHDTRNVYDWHQDSAYDGINLVPSNGVISWCPLIDTNINNGTLIVCPQSHSEPNHINETRIQSPGITRQVTVPNFIIEKYKELSVPVKSGDSLLSYANLIHKSGVNVSTNIRFTLLVRFNIIVTKDFFLYNKLL